MRLFVALNLPDAVREALHAAAAPLRSAFSMGVAWTPVEKLHVTVQFIGDADEATRDVIRGGLAAIASVLAAPPLEMGGIGAFPSMGRPRVLWCGVAPNPPLAALYHEVTRATRTAGIATEARPYRPHVTFGRVRARGAIASARLAEVASQVGWRGTAHARSVDLMESRLDPRGSRYRLLDAFPLATPFMET